MSMIHETRPAVDRPCPEWCEEAPGHGWEGVNARTGRQLRTHGCDLNDAVTLSVDEYADEPGITEQPRATLWVAGNMAGEHWDEWTPAEIRKVAAELLAGADKLEALLAEQA